MSNLKLSYQEGSQVRVLVKPKEKAGSWVINIYIRIPNTYIQKQSINSKETLIIQKNRLLSLEMLFGHTSTLLCQIIFGWPKMVKTEELSLKFSLINNGFQTT